VLNANGRWSEAEVPLLKFLPSVQVIKNRVLNIIYISYVYSDRKLDKWITDITVRVAQ
jgi:hypothetical protein